MFYLFDQRLIKASLLWADAWRDSAATIAMRMPVLAAASRGDADAAHQTTLMMTEKMAAATEGSVAVVMTVMNYNMKLMTGRLRNDEHVKGPLNVWLAASAPARAQVKRNARRLTRQR